MQYTSKVNRLVRVDVEIDTKLIISFYGVIISCLNPMFSVNRLVRVDVETDTKQILSFCGVFISCLTDHCPVLIEICSSVCQN